MPDKTRGERIGRAAFDAREFGDAMWEDLTPGCRADQTKSALAAVAKAREIDTCNTCKRKDGCGILESLLLGLMDGCYHSEPGPFGCSRHEPKGE